MNEPPDGQPPPGGGVIDDRKIVIGNKTIILYKNSDLGPYQVMVESENVRKNSIRSDKKEGEKNTEITETDVEVSEVVKPGESLHIGNYSHLSLAKTILHLNFTDIIKFEKKGRNRLCVTFRSILSANKLLKNETLINMGYSMFIPTNLISCKGVVRYVDTDLTEDEIKQNLTVYNIKVIEVKRLNRRKVDKAGVATYVPTSTIRITFEGKILPKFVDIYRLPMPVQPYMLPVVQCYSCLLYGHIQKNCNGKSKCKNCGEVAATGSQCVECKTRCIHCSSESHTSVSNKCPEYSRQQQVREIMSLENLSLFDANLRVPKPSSKVQYISRTQDFPTLTPNEDNSIPINQRRNFLSQPSNTYSNVASKKRKPAPPTPPPHSQPPPGYDQAAHNSCLFYPNSRFPSSSSMSQTSSSPSSLNQGNSSSRFEPAQEGQVDTLFNIFSRLTETEKQSVFMKLTNMFPPTSQYSSTTNVLG